MMARGATLGCILILIVASVVSQPTNPAPWPLVFSSTCWTYPNGMSGAPVAAKFFYSWPQIANRLNHAAGSYECTQFYHTSGPCSLLFTADQLYGVFPNGTCCVDSPVGALPPNWGDGSTFVGYQTLFGQNTTLWQNTAEHSFNVALDAPNLPVRFGFPDPRQDIFFDSFEFNAIDPTEFQLPEDCTRPCKP